MTNTTQRPRLGSAGILVEDGKLMLGLSKKWNEWVIPGGAVDYMESYQDAVVREIREETGLDVVFDRICDVVELIVPEKDNHRVIVYSYVTRTGGKIQPGDDIAEVGFFDKTEIAQLAADKKLTGLMVDVLVKFGWLDTAQDAAA